MEHTHGLIGTGTNPKPPHPSFARPCCPSTKASPCDSALVTQDMREGAGQNPGSLGSRDVEKGGDSISLGRNDFSLSLL